jgi:phytoene dehydrogenase-like protein
LFKGEKARGLMAGLAGHTILPLDTPGSAASTLILGALAHAVGWPVVKGGSQQIAEALCSYLNSMGGEVVTGKAVSSMEQLPPARAVLMNVTPRQLSQIAGDQLPNGYLKRLARYRYGAGIFKVDWALDGPIPWKAAACRKAGTVHVGGTLEEIAAAEADVWKGKHPETPYVLVVQQSLFDDTRAPPGKHTCWAYCHVPPGSTEDMTEIIANQIERFAPGFRDLILAEFTRDTVQMEAYNANYIGGDIIGGVQDLRQQFTRPVPRLNPYSTPNKGIYICSSSTPPGGGVHGMCGYYAAQAALKGALR